MPDRDVGLEGGAGAVATKTLGERQGTLSPGLAVARRQGGLRARTGWGLLDQVVSSLTNAAVSVLVARSVDAEGFGVFSLAYTVFTVLLGANRAVSVEPLVVRSSRASTERLRADAAMATGSSLAIGAVTGVVILALTTVVGDDLGDSLWVLGFAVPALLLQDTWRHVFFAAGRPAAAVANDLVWAGVQAVGMGVAVVLDLASPQVLLAAWGLAGLAGALAGARQTRLVPRPDRTLAWLREHRDISGVLLSEYMVTMGAFHASVFLLGLIGTVTDIGAIRGAQVLLGPAQVLFLGFTAVALPELSRREPSATVGALSVSGTLAGVLGGVTALWVSVLLLVPDSVGTAALGSTWMSAREVLPGLGLMQVAIGVGLGFELGLRALAAARSVLRVSAQQAPLTVGLALAGMALAGAPGAALGYGAAHVFGACQMWRSLRVTLVRRAS